MTPTRSKLGDYVLPVRSVNPIALVGDSDFTYVDISSVDRELREIASPQVIPANHAPSRARQETAENDVIVSTVRPNLNTVAIVTGEHAGAIASTGFCVLRAVPGELDARYLFHWISSQAAVKQLVELATGATYPAVSDKTIKSLPFAPPSLTEQQRISVILDKADSLRRKRQEAIRLSDELLRSAFFDLFGDPVGNSENWSEREIVEIGKVTTGNTPSRDVDAYFGDAIEWIKSDNINTASHWLTKAREGLSELGATVARTAPSGSTLMTCIAGSPSCIGNVAMANRAVAFNQQINAVTPLANIEPEFVYALLLFSKARIQATSTNSMKGMVSKGTLERVKLIWPPAGLRERFVQIFKQVQRLQSRMESADATSLFNALQSKLLA